MQVHEDPAIAAVEAGARALYACTLDALGAYHDTFTVTDDVWADVSDHTKNKYRKEVRAVIGALQEQSEEREAGLGGALRALADRWEVVRDGYLPDKLGAVVMQNCVNDLRALLDHIGEPADCPKCAAMRTKVVEAEASVADASNAVDDARREVEETRATLAQWRGDSGLRAALQRRLANLPAMCHIPSGYPMLAMPKSDLLDLLNSTRLRSAGGPNPPTSREYGRALQGRRGFEDQHWLTFGTSNRFEGSRVTGCHCGFVAAEEDEGWGDSVIRHIADVARDNVKSAGGPDAWCPKMLREYLCKQQGYAPDERSQRVIQVAIDMLDSHRPIGSNGKHGDRHTTTCGCEDVTPVGQRPFKFERRSRVYTVQVGKQYTFLVQAGWEPMPGRGAHQQLVDQWYASDMVIENATGRVVKSRFTTPWSPDRRAKGADLIADERTRQCVIEGYTLEHDANEHAPGGLALAAACYATPLDRRVWVAGIPNLWPWSPSDWKPSPTDRVKELVKAGALCAAEIDRIQAGKR